MIKQISPGTQPINEVYCDGCKNLIAAEGKDYEYDHELTMYINSMFGLRSKPTGFQYNAVFCEECTLKSLIAIEIALGIKILENKE